MKNIRVAILQVLSEVKSRTSEANARFAEERRKELYDILLLEFRCN
jgi:hypothetical protein